MKSNTKKIAGASLGATALLAAISAIWFGCAPREVAPVTIRLDVAPYRPAAIGWSPLASEPWPAPDAQPVGTLWRYEVFSPPLLVYNRRNRNFRLPPRVGADGAAARAPSAAPASFGITLRAVRRDLFRLQLIGFVGGADDRRGVFACRDSHETVLAGAGKSLAGLGLTIDRLEVRHRSVSLPENLTIRRLVATATVRDDQTGESVTLTDIEPCTTTRLVATIARAGELERTEEVREGDEVKVGNAVFRVDRIQLDPTAIGLIRQASGDAMSGDRTLTLEAEKTPPNSDSESL